jgi:hypothetical protein
MVLMLAAIVNRRDWPSMVLFVVGGLMFLSMLLR